MKQVDIRFANRRDVLGAYWGYLTGGGLVIEDAEGLDEGQRVHLRVTIDGAPAGVELDGRVVKRPPDSRRVVVAFDPGESNNRLLTVALSESEVDLQASLLDERETPTTSVHLYNISDQGCCVRLSDDVAERFDVGQELRLETPAFRVTGCVVWASGADRFILFGGDDGEAVAQVRDFLASRESETAHA